MPTYDINGEYKYSYTAEITTKNGESCYYCEVEADNDEDAIAVFREFFLYDFPNEQIDTIEITEKIELEYM